MMIKERKNDLKGRLRPEMHGFREITLRKKIPKGKNKSRVTQNGLRHEASQITALEHY